MPYAHAEDRNRNQRERYVRNPAPFRAARQKWTAANRDKVSMQQTRWRACNVEKVRIYGRRAAFLQRLKRYGITGAEYAALWMAQGRVCKSCGTSDLPSKKGWCLDHSHDDGRVRGIICPACNIIAGHARDNPEHLRAVAAYLERC